MSVIYSLDNESGAVIIGDGGENTNGLLQLTSASATIPALNVKRNVAGSATIAPLRINGTSAASAALLGFGGGFISLTSVIFTTVANFDYAIPVEVGGVQRYIPLVGAAGLVGAAAF